MADLSSNGNGNKFSSGGGGLVTYRAIVMVALSLIMIFLSRMINDVETMIGQDAATVATVRDHARRLNDLETGQGKLIDNYGSLDHRVTVIETQHTR